MAISPVRWKHSRDAAWMDDVLVQHWGGLIAIINGETLDVREHPTLIAGERDGLAIFRLDPKPEVLLLHALTRGAGVGTALLQAVVERVRDHGEARLFVTTTNDNADALQFYKSNGFLPWQTREGAVDRARLLKPSIPLVASNGAPIRDEIELVLVIEPA